MSGQRNEPIPRETITDQPANPPDAAEPEWLSTQGLGKMLGGISASTIRGWRLAGIGPPFVRLGGLVRYRRSEVERWISAGGDRKAVSDAHR